MPLAFINSTIPTEGKVLAADIGGTKANMALFEIDGKTLNALRIKSYKTKDHLSFLALLKKFLAGPPNSIDAVCLGVAGPVIDGRVQGTNFPWVIDREDIKDELKIENVYVINDLRANAYGLAALEESDFKVLKTGEKVSGNAAMLSPGTGLGEAGLYWDGAKYHPFATEGGHCYFSPKDDLDVKLWEFMQQKYGTVSWERVLSGQGICDIHSFLRMYRGTAEPIWFAQKTLEEDLAAVITSSAMQEADPVFVETFELFIRFLATEAALLALKMKATGGIFVGGGIVPKIIKGINEDVFTANFVHSGQMASLLEIIPVKVILNDKTPLLGAALYGAMGTKG